MNQLCIASIVAILMACGGPGPRDITTPRKVPSASGAPSISKVTDLGDLGALPKTGRMPRADSDGVFVVGELVLIEGRNFGKQPTVNIGGRPAESVARTGSGGIIARVPIGVPTGRIEIEVSHPGGRDSMAVQVRRYGFVVQPDAGKVFVVVQTKRDGELQTSGELEIAKARSVAVSHDGQVALVAADPASTGESARLGVIAVTASGGPKLVRELKLPNRDAGMVECATRAPLGVVAGSDGITLIDLEDSRNPAHYDLFPANDGKPLTAIALSPKGRWLVALAADNNRLLPVDISAPSRPRPGAAVSVLPEARVPLVRDLGFSPTGDAVFIIAGDNSEALAAGMHPTRIIALAADKGDFRVQSSSEIADAKAPLELAVARRESIAGGTAIQSRSKRVALAVAAIERSALRQPQPDSELPELGQLLRTDLDGEGLTLASDAGVISSVAMSHDVSFVAAATARRGADGLDFGLTVVPLAGGQPRFVALGKGPAESLLSPASVALAP